VSVSVLVVDDHAVVREGIRAVLLRQGSISLVDEAGDGWAAVHACQARQYDVVIMDISMPGLGGVQATRELLKVSPATRVLALSMHGDRDSIQEALRAGALGYVRKSAVTEELVAAVEAVREGRVYVGDDVSRVLVEDYVRSLRNEPVAPGALSVRERQVLKMVAEGMTAKEMGAALGVSPRTVEMHRARLMKKTGVDSVAGLTRYAITHNITTL